MTSSPVVTGLDLGSAKIAAVVGEYGLDGHIKILGIGESPSLGIRRGTVVDIESTAKAIEEAISKAARMSGIAIESVFVSVAGADIRSVNNRGVVAISGPDSDIYTQDVARVLEAAQVSNITPDREVIHVLPREFTVDGYGEVLDPVGMNGSRLEVETHVITAYNSCLQNIVKSVHKAGLRLEQPVLSSLASGEAVLLPEEKKNGVLLIDIGAGTTDSALYDRGSLWYSAVLPVGGEHVTRDLSFGLRSSVEAAEKIKLNNGLVLASMAPDNEYIEVPHIGGTDQAKVSLKMIASIIEPRVVEIFDLVKKGYIESGYKGILASGVVLTGGLAEMPGIRELAAERLGLPVRIGHPVKLGGLADMAQSPRLATAIGLVRYGTRYCEEAAPAEDDIFGPFTKLLAWVRKVLPL